MTVMIVYFMTYDLSPTWKFGTTGRFARRGGGVRVGGNDSMKYLSVDVLQARLLQYFMGIFTS